MLFITVQPFAYVVADYTCHNREYKVKEFYQNVTPSTVWLEMGNDMDEGHYRKLLIVLYMKYSRYLKLMSEGNTMNDAIAMMFSILIVMFGYLVFKIRTDQSQSTTASTRKRSKKRGTGKPVIKITGICDHWTQKILQTKICGMRIL